MGLDTDEKPRGCRFTGDPLGARTTSSLMPSLFYDKVGHERVSILEPPIPEPPWYNVSHGGKMRRAAIPNYTPREVWEADGGILTLGEDELRGLISAALSKVPKRVANKVFKGCIFVMAKFEWGAGTYIPREILEGKCVIALSERLMDEDRKSAVRTVLHEVAHFYLGHMPPGLIAGSGDGCDCRQEHEAEAKVDDWLKADRKARRARQAR